MSLASEIEVARKEIVSDGYDMSIGEVMNLYRDKELRIDPEFQRLFRWDISQKTRFIESILLGIPIPPIFVFQEPDGTWELIDGLQRLSTLLEFSGLLVDPDGKRVTPSVLEGTLFLPSLSNKTWDVWEEESNAIDKSMQLQIKRSRLRVEILLKESDEQAKFELFQRLNTGGSQLSPQEIRNCVTVMINKELHARFKRMSVDSNFVLTTCQTDSAIEKQVNLELVLRFFSFRNVRYSRNLDVHEYLDSALIKLAQDNSIDWDKEEDCFRKTFSLIADSLGEDAFKKWYGNGFKGSFLMSLFEVVAYGVSENIDHIQKLSRDDQKEFVSQKAKDLWSNSVFLKNSGAGVRGTTRLANLLPLAKVFFR